MKSLTRTAVVLVMAVFMLLSGTSLAQDKQSRAKEHYKRGKTFFKQKQYDQALRELMEAYKLDPNPVLVFNIARVHEDKEDYYNAIKYYESYVLMVKNRIKKRKAKRKLKKLKKLLKRQAKMGFLAIQTFPPGATIRVDGREVGKSPISANRLKPGRHNLEISLPNFETHRAQLLILNGQTTQVSFQLREMPGTIVLSTVPAGAVARVFGAQPRSLGACPCAFQAAAGRYKVEVSKPGFQPKTIEFEKVTGQLLRLNVSLVPVAQVGTGTLFVNSVVPGANIIVDGSMVGSTPLSSGISVLAGRRNIVVSALGYQSWSSVVVIRPGQMTRVDARLTPARMNPRNPPPDFPIKPNVANNFDTSGSGGSTAGWVTLWSGIGALAAAGGTTTWMLLEKQAYENSTLYKVNPVSQYKGLDLARADLTRAQTIELTNRIKVLEILTYSVGGAGIAAVITGIILIASDDGDDDESYSGTNRPIFSITPFSQGGMMNFHTRF